MRGTLVLVVGPSGAGKDSVIRGAREVLAGDCRLHFARRCITRPADAGGEDHEAIDHETFERWRREERFALSWQAHGLGYGIARMVESHLASGRCVVANVSRTVVEDALVRLSPVLLVNVTASPEILSARLKGRGREDNAAIKSRLARTGAPLPDGSGLMKLRNEGAIEDAVARFVARLRKIASVSTLPTSAGS